MIGINPLLGQIGPTWLTTWFTPIWIISTGVLLGLLILLAIWAATFVFSRRAAMEVPETAGEGPLLWIFIVTVLFSIFCLGGYAFVHAPADIIASVPRLFFTGEQALTKTIEVTAVDEFDTIDLDYAVVGSELSLLRIEADQPIFIGPPSEDQATEEMIEVLPGTSFEWIRGKESISPLGEDSVSSMAVANFGGTAATVELTVGTRPVYPQSKAILVSAVSVVGIFLLYFLQQIFLPKMSAISLSTCKSHLASPIFLILTVFGAFALAVFVFIPYNTFGDDIKMLKDSGFTLIMVLAIVHAILAASQSVSEEIDGKTALTVLSKPVSRRQFVFGKFIGISWSVAVLFIVLGAVFVVLVAYKPVYDARETSKMAPIWEDSYVEVVRTFPGLLLAFMETVVLTALSVAISTRLPLLPNIAICFAIYTLGHLTPLLVQSGVGSLAPVAFMGKFISAVLPVLEAFNIQAAVAAGREVPYDYLTWAFLYCCLYSLVAMLLALILFEDRDLA